MVDTNAKDGDGDTPLLLATQQEHRNIFEMLLAKQLITVDARNNNGWTPLAWVAEDGHKSTVELLLCNGSQR